MKHICMISMVLAISIPFCASAASLPPVHFWSENIGGTNWDGGNSVVVDPDGNVILAGFFRGTVDFGGGPLVSAGDADIFLAKYDAAGVHVWSKRIGASGSDRANSVALSSAGDIYVAGSFQGTVDFGGGNLVSAGSDDVYLASYSSTGVHRWSRRFGGTMSDLGQCVAVDSWGNATLTGDFYLSADFGGGVLTSAGGPDAFLAQYTSGGGYLWSKRLGGTSNDWGYSVAVDDGSNIVLTGFFMGTVDFGGGALASAGGSMDIFLARYNSSGSHLWSKRLGGTSNDLAYSVAVDAQDAIYVTGYFAGTADFGGGNLTSAGGVDAVVAKYNSAGTHLWSRRLGGTGTDYGTTISADDAGNAIVAGLFQGTADFGFGPVTSAGGYDIFFGRYGDGGVHRWSLHFGAASDDYATSVCASSPVHLILTGRFQGTINCGGSDLTSAGGEDILLARYAVDAAEPIIQSIADIGDDEGRKVRIVFSRSGFDAPLSMTSITGYEVYRRDDALETSPVLASRRQLLMDGWVFAGELAAHGSPEYLVDAPTDADSTILLGQFYSTFLVRAATGDPIVYFDSPPDSGYSVDNLAPDVPGGLMSNIGFVTWNKCANADFDYFTVYGSPTADFGDAVLFDYTTDTSMNLKGSGYSWAFVTATDFSGNESPPGSVKVATGIGDTPRSYVLSVTNFPNPFNPSTTVSYTVPSRGSVTLIIYDARGARVATLVNNEVRDTGAYRTAWNGRADNGAAVASGVYFARVIQDDAVRSKKMVLLK